ALVTVAAPERISPISGIVMVCAAGLFAVFAHEMVRPERRELTASLTGTVAGTFVAAIAACWITAQSAAVDAGSAGLVTAVAAGLAGTLLLNTTALPALPRFVLSTLVGAGVTAVLAVVLNGLGPAFGAVLGLVT